MCFLLSTLWPGYFHVCRKHRAPLAVSLQSCPSLQSPQLPQLFSFKNMGLQEPPSHQWVVRKTLREFLMKYDMPDKPGLLEACYFEVFPSAVLPFNKTWCWNQIVCSTLDSPAEIRKPHMCWPIFVIINLFRKSRSCSSHSCCLILCKSTRICVHWEREIDMHFKVMCVPVS